MITAHEELAAIAREGAQSYSATALASNHGPVTRRVRRHRAVRGSVTAVAGVGIVGAGTFGALQLRGADALAPMGSPSPTMTPAQSSAPTDSPEPTASPSPKGDLPEGGIVEVEAGERAEAILARLAEAYDVDEARAREAIRLQLPPEAGGEPEGWLAEGEHATWTEDGAASRGTLTDQASSLVTRTELVLGELDVPRESWQEVLTIASLVEEESVRPEDMPQVARVILNRLDQGMRLELDSTVRYALGVDQREEPFTSAEDREVDSAYNTYANTGLPPTPIGTPSREAIEAAVDPADGPWLYFVVIDADTGEMAFAEDFAQHQENVMLLQESLRDNQ